MSITTQDRSSNYLQNLLAASGDGEGADLVNFLGKVLADLKRLDVHNTESDFTDTLATLETDKAANSNFEFLEVIANAVVVLRLLGDGKLQTSDIEPLADGTSSIGTALLKFLNAYFSGTVTANAFVGDGSQLTNLGAVNVAGGHFDGDLSQTLTGTVSVANSDATVTGSSTLFTSELGAGAAIEIDGEIHTVASIASDTELELDAVFAGSTGSGLTANVDGNLMQFDSGDGKTRLRLDRAGVFQLLDYLGNAATVGPLTADRTVNFDSSMSAATIQALIDKQPRDCGAYELTFQFADGTYTINSALEFTGFNGRVNILGNASDNSAADTKSVKFTCSVSDGVVIKDCTAVNINYIEFNSTNARCIRVEMSRVFMQHLSVETNSSASDGYILIQVNDSNAFLDECNFGLSYYGLQANRSRVGIKDGSEFSASGPLYGTHANVTSEIINTGVQISGTTADTANNVGGYHT